MENNNNNNNNLNNISIEIFSPQKRLPLKHTISQTTKNDNKIKKESSLKSEQNDKDMVMLNVDDIKQEEEEEEINNEDNELFQSKRLVIPGQTISREGEYLKGHGTFNDGSGNLVASVCGTLDKVDRLVSVKALKARYHGEVGDIIVGRITEITSKRWKVDVNSRLDYILMLSAINLPGGIQRRRTSADELQMRSFFVENDLVYAEVQMVMGDGSVAIHTRNQKYGKLQNGHFTKVIPSLIKRSKQHFYNLECGVDVILGINGYIWIADSEQQRNQQQFIQKHEKEPTFDPSIPLIIPDDIKQVSKESRDRIARVKNSISLLEKGFLLIHQKSIMKVYKLSLKMKLQSKDLLHPQFIKQILTVLSTTDYDDDDDDNNNENDQIN
ncbi:hypothetical protein ACTFIZ_007679 [Dictyostelium cf. discoideum]